MRTAVVTGAGRAGGIGRAIAARLKADGFDVLLSDLERPMASHPEYESAPPTALQEAADALGVRTFPCDVRSTADVEALFEHAGRVDVLVNNAGVAIGVAPVTEVSDADWDVNLDVMAGGVFRCARAAARRMIDQGEGGRIITVASQAGLAGQAWLSAYCAAKFAAIG